MSSLTFVMAKESYVFPEWQPLCVREWVGFELTVCTPLSDTVIDSPVDGSAFHHSVRTEDRHHPCNRRSLDSLVTLIEAIVVAVEEGVAVVVIEAVPAFAAETVVVADPYSAAYYASTVVQTAARNSS